MSGSIISKRFLRGQIWHWVDPIYGAKKKGDENNYNVYLKEATQRFNRYVLIVQNDRTIDNKSILVMPLTTKRKYDSDIEINIKHSQMDGITYIRPRLIFPVSPMALSSYVCTLSDTDMKVIEEHLYYLTMSLCSGPVSELYERDLNNSLMNSDYHQIDKFFDTFVVTGVKQTVTGQDMFNAYRKYCIINKLTISNTLTFINRINNRLYGNDISNNARHLKDVILNNVKIQEITKVKENADGKHSNKRETGNPSPFPIKGKVRNSLDCNAAKAAKDAIDVISDIIADDGKIIRVNSDNELDNDSFINDYETKGELYAMKKWNLTYKSTRAKYRRLCHASNRACVMCRLIPNPENISNYIDLDNARIAEVMYRALIIDKDVHRNHLCQLLGSNDPMKVDAVIRTMTALKCIEFKDTFQTDIIEPINDDTMEFIRKNYPNYPENLDVNDDVADNDDEQDNVQKEDTLIANIIINRILTTSNPVYDENLRNSVTKEVGKGLCDQLFIKMAELKIIWPRNDRYNLDGSLRIIPKDYKVLTDTAIDFLINNTSNEKYNTSYSLFQPLLGFDITAINIENYKNNIEVLADQIVNSLKSFINVTAGKHVKVGKSGSKRAKGALSKMWSSIKDAIVIYISEKAGSLYIRNENFMIYPKYYDSTKTTIQSELSSKTLYATLDKFNFQFIDRYLDLKNNRSKIDMLIKEELKKHKIWFQELKYQQLITELVKL